MKAYEKLYLHARICKHPVGNGSGGRVCLRTSAGRRKWSSNREKTTNSFCHLDFFCLRLIIHPAMCKWILSALCWIYWIIRQGHGFSLKSVIPRFILTRTTNQQQPFYRLRAPSPLPQDKLDKRVGFQGRKQYHRRRNEEKGLLILKSHGNNNDSVV